MNFPSIKAIGRLALQLGAVALMAGGALANDNLLELQQDPNQWAISGGSYSGLNYSELDQINRDNVDELEVAWTFQTGVLDVHEAQTLVVDDTMFVVTPKPNTVYALDLADYGRIKWSYQANQPDLQTAIQRACCGAQTRGFAYAEGMVLLNTLDGQVVALDAEDGTEVWKVQNGDLSVGETMSTAPLVAGNLVIVGVAGGEYGIQGHVSAYDLHTGERAWRFYNTGPDDQMGITDRFQPFYAADQVDQPGVSSWYGDSWRRGGASIWGWFTFDPELNMFYYGTGNCAPWNPDYRRDPATAPGLDVYGNKYCAAVMARDATTGELIWAYSLTPQDQWDYDEPAVFMLVDLEVDGAERAAIVHQSRNGFIYVMDRQTGELLAEPWKWTTVNWADRIDMATGQPIYNPDQITYTGKTIENVCPISAGPWEQQSYSPQTGLFYFTGHNSCFSSYTMVKGDYVPGQNYGLFESGGFDRGSPMGVLYAADPLTGEIAWSVETETVRNNRPLLTTAGGLVFQGTQLGDIKAFDAETGDELWSFRAGSGFRNSAMTYTGPDGRQYVAIIASSGPSTQQVAFDADPGAEGRYSRAGSTLFVFALPEEVASAETAGE